MEELKFKYRDGDITEFDGDAIINSVGVDTDNYGGICRSIIEANPTNEIKTIIDSTNNLYTAGELFTTAGYQLKAGHIVHLICPLSKDDDKNYSLYKECIRWALNECQKNNWFNVGIPSIGTGANKYDKEKVHKIISEMCHAYCEAYPEMRITFVRPDDELSSTNARRLNDALYTEEFGYHDAETYAKSKKGSLILQKTSKKLKKDKYSKEYFAFNRYKNPKHELVSFHYEKIKMLGDYVSQYCDQCKNNGDDGFAFISMPIQRINLYFGYGTSGKKSYTTIGSDAYGEIKKKKNPDKKSLYKIIFALKMPEDEAERMLAFFGFAFSRPGYNEVDDIVHDLIKHKKYGIVEIEQAFKNKGIPSLFKR